MLLFDYYWNNNRSSRPEVLCEKGVPRHFPKFTGKHVCQSLFFNKVVGLRPATLLKKRPRHRCFPVNFGEFLRTPFRASFLTEHLWWLFFFFYDKTKPLVAASIIIILLISVHITQPEIL